MHVDPLDADAGLPGVEHGAPERGVGGGVDVGVVVDDHGVLAAASISTGVRFSAQAAITFLPVAVRAGEGELVDAGAAQRGAGLTQAGDDLEHRLLGHRLGEGVGEPLPHPGGDSLGLKTTALPAASA